MRKLFMAAFISYGLATTPVMAQKLRQARLQVTIDSLYTVEAKLYQQLAAARSDSTLLVAERTHSRTTERHQHKLQALTSQYGFPTYSMVGQVASRHFGELILRYKRLPELQQQVQQLMSKEIGKQNIDEIMFATLTDVVELQAGRPQVYGTQLAYQGAKKELVVREPLVEPAQVNVRRAGLKLEPLEVYLKKQKSKHQPKVK